MSTNTSDRDSVMLLTLNVVSQVIIALQWVVFAITVRRACARWRNASSALTAKGGTLGSARSAESEQLDDDEPRSVVATSASGKKRWKGKEKPMRDADRILLFKLRLTFGMLVGQTIRVVDTFGLFIDAWSYVAHAAAFFFAIFALIWSIHILYHIIEATVKTQLGTIGQSFPTSMLYVWHTLDVVYTLLMLTCIVGILVQQTALYVVIMYLALTILSTSLALGTGVGVYVVCARLRQAFPDMSVDCERTGNIARKYLKFKRDGVALTGFVGHFAAVSVALAVFLWPQRNVRLGSLTGAASVLLPVAHHFFSLVGTTITQVMQW